MKLLIIQLIHSPVSSSLFAQLFSSASCFLTLPNLFLPLMCSHREKHVIILSVLSKPSR